MSPLKVSILCAVLSAALYSNTLHGEFVYDDSRAIVANEDIRPSTSWWNLWSHDFWGTPLSHRGSHKSWRPLCVLSFRLNFYLAGLDPWGYHLMNVALYGAVSFLFCQLTAALVKDPWLHCVTGLAFSVHPIHCEAVANIVGRAELGAALHLLMALLFYSAHIGERDKQPGPSRVNSEEPSCRHHTRELRIHEKWGNWKPPVYLAAAIFSATCSMLWKETGMTAIPLCAFMDLARIVSSQPHDPITAIFFRKKYGNVRSSLCALVISGVCLFLLRLYMLDGAAPSFSLADNPMAKESSLLTRTLTLLYLPPLNLWLLLCPARLSFDWSMDSVAPITCLHDPRNFVTLTFYCGAGALACRSISRRCEWPLMALALLTLTFLPASNMFFYVGFVIAERVLFVPSMGFALTLAYALDAFIRTPAARNRKKLRMFVGWAIMGTLLLWATKTVTRNHDWNCEEQLYRSGITVNPAKAYGNLGVVLSRQNRKAEAEYAYRKALQHRPNMAEVHFNLAMLLQNQGRDQEAIKSYLQAIHHHPKLAQAYVSLAQLLAQHQRYQESSHWLRKCSQLSDQGTRDPLSHRKTRLTAMHQWAKLESSNGQHHQAIQIYHKALELCSQPSCEPQFLYNAMGDSFQALGDNIQAELWYRKALYAKPDYVTSHLNYAKFLALNTSRHDEAEQLFRKAQTLAPQDPMVHLLAGQFLLESSRNAEAAECFIRAAFLSPTSFDAVFNAATTLRELNQMQSAEEYYRQAARLRPQDVVVYRNLGAILHVNGKWEEAEANYFRALQLVPDDPVTTVNLQRLHQLMNARGFQPNRTNPFGK